MNRLPAAGPEAGRLALLESALVAVSPDAHEPRWFYPSLGHQDALERLRHSSVPGTLVVISGASGIGKTLLLNVLLETLPGSIVPVVTGDPEANRTDTRFLRSLIEAEGGIPKGRTGLDLTSEFLDGVAATGEEGRMTTILIDDAHKLSSSQLEIVRTLVSSAGTQHPLNAVVFGEPELIDKIARKRRLAGRVTLHHALNPLNPDDAAAMLSHRLQEAGVVPEQLFAEGATSAIYASSGGIPGLMLRLVHDVIERTLSDGTSQIDAAAIEQAAEGSFESAPHARTQLVLFEASAGIDPQVDG